MDVRNCSIAEKSKTGVKMPLLEPGSQNVLSHGEDGEEPVEMYLVLLGPESPVVTRALAQARNRASRDQKNHTPSDEQIKKEAVSDSKLLAGLTVGGLVFMDDAWLEITAENAYDLYYDIRPFRGQALSFILNEANFTKG